MHFIDAYSDQLLSGGLSALSISGFACCGTSITTALECIAINLYEGTTLRAHTDRVRQFKLRIKGRSFRE